MKKNKILAIGLGIIIFTIIANSSKVSANAIEEPNVSFSTESEIIEEDSTEEITLIERIDIAKEFIREEISEDITDNLKNQQNKIGEIEISKPSFGFSETNITQAILILIMFLIFILCLICIIYVIRTLNLNTNDE